LEGDLAKKGDDVKKVILAIFCMVFLVVCGGEAPNPTRDTESGSQPEPVPVPEGYIIDDFTFYATPDIQRPSKGETYIDPVFKTSITRVTDSATEAVTSRDFTLEQPGYPKHDIENADGTLLLIQAVGGSGWAIFDANTFNFIKWIPTSLIGWSRPIDARWSKTDPNIIYYQMFGKFWRYNIVTDENIALFDFKALYPPTEGSDYPNCAQTMKEEGEPSMNGRLWAFSIYCHDPNHAPKWYDAALVVLDKDYYDFDQPEIISSITPADPQWNSAGLGYASVSPSGDYVMTSVSSVFPIDLSSRTPTGLSCCHADWGISEEGREVILGSKYIGSGKYAAAMVDVETKEITILSPPLSHVGVHYSANNYDKPGWGLVSMYAPSAPDVPDAWGEHEVFLVELTKRTDPPPHVWRLANTHTMKKSYADDPFAKINRAGTKVWFGTGWGASIGDAGTHYDVYQIDIPQE
jgi:hypothetical protein